MEVYVTKKPKSCLDCEFCNKENYCCWLIQKDVREYRDDCPLKSLKDHDRAVKQHAYKKGYNDMRIQYELGDYTKQVRKEVVQEIKKQVIQSTCYDTEEEVRNVIYDLNASSVLEILDQLLGEDNG